MWYMLAEMQAFSSIPHQAYPSSIPQYGWDFFETEASKTYLKTSLEDDDKTESSWPSWRGAHDDDDAHNRLMFPGSLSWHRINYSNSNIKSNSIPNSNQIDEQPAWCCQLTKAKMTKLITTSELIHNMVEISLQLKRCGVQDAFEVGGAQSY